MLETKRKKTSDSLLRLTQMGLLSALAIVIGLFKFPILPAAPFLEFDFADTPILIGTLLFGSVPGLAILFVVSTIQAFLLGGNGLIGLIMHFIASGSMLLAVSVIFRRKRTLPSLVFAMIAGTLVMTLVMIPLNYLLTPLYLDASAEVITTMLLPAIIPFNLIKAGGNCLLAAVLFRMLSPMLARSGLKIALNESR